MCCAVFLSLTISSMSPHSRLPDADSSRLHDDDLFREYVKRAVGGMAEGAGWGWDADEGEEEEEPATSGAVVELDPRLAAALGQHSSDGRGAHLAGA